MQATVEPIILLRASGMLPYFKGYSYLLCALKLISEVPEKLHCLTTSVYPEIAGIFNVNPNTIDRSIRYLIKRAWDDPKIH